MHNFILVDKHNGDTRRLSLNDQQSELALTKAEIVVFSGVSPKDVASMVREGNSLVVTMNSGKVITIKDFFSVYGNTSSALVLDSAQGSDGLWLAAFDSNGTFSQLTSIDSIQAVYAPGDVAAAANLLPLIPP